MTDLIPGDMSDTAMFSVVIGFFVPIVVNLIVNVKWPSWVKSVVSFIFSAIVGAILALLTGAYEGLGIPSAILLTFVVAIAAYSQFWKQVAPGMQAKVGVGSRSVD